MHSKFNKFPNNISLTVLVQQPSKNIVYYIAFSFHVPSDFFNLISFPVPHVFNNIKEYRLFILWYYPLNMCPLMFPHDQVQAMHYWLHNGGHTLAMSHTDDVKIVTSYLPGFSIINPFLDRWLDQKEQRYIVRELGAFVWILSWMVVLFSMFQPESFLPCFVYYLMGRYSDTSIFCSFY